MGCCNVNENNFEGSTNDFKDCFNSCVDRFDLEIEIIKQLDINDTLELVVEHLLESDNIDIDIVTNILTGAIEAHRLRNEKLFDIFTQVFRLDKYKDVD